MMNIFDINPLFLELSFEETTAISGGIVAIGSPTNSSICKEPKYVPKIGQIAIYVPCTGLYYSPPIGHEPEFFLGGLG